MSEDQQAWDSYPNGLKVLAVDDDPLCLKVVEQMLRRCNYEVRTAENGKEALRQLRDKRLQIDLVLSDVYMPDMDGFKLLETIGLELDLPVIMMSSNGETPVVLRGVTHGAVDFLIKPVRIEELRNVWQHVVRRRKDQVQNSKEGSGEEEVVDGNRQDKKRKEAGAREGEGDHTSTKKPRVVWSVEMHQQFVNAVNLLGIDKAVPKRILDLMSVEGLTRENVASHLQKYRLYLKRVAGVQGAPAGRGGKAQPLEPAPPAWATAGGPLLIPAPGLAVPEEELKRQLQMQHLSHQQGMAAQPAYVKQEARSALGLSGQPGIAPLMMVPQHYGNGNGLANGLAPDYGPALPVSGPFDSSGAAVGPHGGGGLLPMHSGTFDAASLGAPSHQTFGPESTATLVYPPAPLLPPGAPGLGLPPDGLDPSHPPGGVSGPMEGEHEHGLANGGTDADMENFINILLAPNE